MHKLDDFKRRFCLYAYVKLFYALTFENDMKIKILQMKNRIQIAQ